MNNSMTGATLIEVLLYTAIFMIVMGGVMLIAFGMLTTAEQTNAQIEVSENARFVTQHIEDLVRNSVSINSPSVGTTATSLSVNIDSNSVFQQYGSSQGWGNNMNPVIYSISNGVLSVQIGSITTLPLTNSFVTASISFQNNSYSPETKNTIRVRGVIKSVASTRPASTSLDFSVSLD